MESANYDFLEIYDGKDTSVNKIGKYGGETIPNDITSSGNQLYLHFESDSSGNYKGFAASFSSGKQYFHKKLPCQKDQMKN